MAKDNKTVDRIQAVWNILGGEDGVDRLLRGEVTVSEPERNWREENGEIYLTVTSDGTTGPEWIERLKEMNFRISNYAKSVLCSADFNPTDGITTEVMILKGELFEDNDRITKKIRAEAERRNIATPNAEIACLIREKFSDEEIEKMGLWRIVAMHKAIKTSGGRSGLLGVSRGGDGRWLSAYYAYPGGRWDLETGFAFVVSQASPES